VFVINTQVKYALLDPSSPEKDQDMESRQPVMMIPYITGMNEDIRRVCRKFDIRRFSSPDRLSTQ